MIYKTKKTKEKAQLIENDIIKKVLTAREKHPKMGARVLYHHLNIKEIGINKFEKIVSQNGLSVVKRKKRIVTTQGVYENCDTNLINGLVLNDINQVISGDITYLILKTQTYYIFTLKDMYSKRIVGLYGSQTMHAIHALNTLKQAIKTRGQGINNCIHHTDAGSQYKSNIYKKALIKNKLQMSIAENCLQNGMAEQLNGIIKNDYMTAEIKNVSDLNRKLTQIKYLINNERPVEGLGYKTPVEYEEWIKDLQVKPRLELYDFTK